MRQASDAMAGHQCLGCSSQAAVIMYLHPLSSVKCCHVSHLLIHSCEGRGLPACSKALRSMQQRDAHAMLWLF